MHYKWRMLLIIRYGSQGAKQAFIETSGQNATWFHCIYNHSQDSQIIITPWLQWTNMAYCFCSSLCLLNSMGSTCTTPGTTLWCHAVHPLLTVMSHVMSNTDSDVTFQCWRSCYVTQLPIKSRIKVTCPVSSWNSRMDLSRAEVLQNQCD